MVVVEAETVVYGYARCQELGLCVCLDRGVTEHLNKEGYRGMEKTVVQSMASEIKEAQARDSAEGVRKHLQKLVLAWPKRTRRLVRAYLTGTHECEMPVKKPVRAKRPREENEDADDMSLSQLQEMSAAFNLQVCTTKAACRRRINEALQQQCDTKKALEEKMRQEIKEKKNASKSRRRSERPLKRS